jgi:hypothetical protein
VLEKTLEKVVGKFIDVMTRRPAVETVRKDFYSQAKLSELLALLDNTIDLVYEEGMDIDKHFMSQLTKSEWQRQVDILVKAIYTSQFDKETLEILDLDSSRKYLFAYAKRELNWTAVSILSASYVSANILMRSIFELLIGIATRKTGCMSKRIHAIPFLSAKQKKKMKKLWNELNAWTHPYGKWVKECCPIFVSYKPMYHSKLCKQSVEKFEKVVDVLIVIALNKFEISKNKFHEKTKEWKIHFSNLEIFYDR